MKHILGSLILFWYNEVFSHVPISWLRRLYLRMFFRGIHPSARLLMHVRLLGFRHQIGERVVVNQHCVLDARHHELKIAHDTDIGPYSRLWTLGHDPDHTSHAAAGASLHLGHHVWVASGATVLPGAHLADGAVVAAGSVVTRPVGEKQVVGGNPAKLIRQRQNDLTYTLSYRAYWE